MVKDLGKKVLGKCEVFTLMRMAVSCGCTPHIQ